MTVIFNSDGPSLALISAPAVLTVINMTKRLQDILTVLFDNVFQLITILWISRVKPINFLKLCQFFVKEAKVKIALKISSKAGR